MSLLTGMCPKCKEKSNNGEEYVSCKCDCHNTNCKLCQAKLFEYAVIYESISLKKVKVKCSGCGVEFSKLVYK